MEYIKNLWQQKEIRVFIWNMLSLFIGTALTLMANDVIHIEEPYLSMIWLVVVPAITQWMKTFNNKYLNDAWVTDETKVKELEDKIKKIKNKEFINEDME